MIETVLYSSMLILLGAILLDLCIGDPKWLPHPVIGIGNMIAFLEKKWNQGKYKKMKGLALTVIVVGFVYAISFLLIWLAYKVHFYIGVGLEIYLISSTIAIKGLRDAASQVLKPLVQGDLIEARENLSLIVGRDTQNLEEPEIVRGTVETVAENTVDGITAPLFWAFLGGAPLALAYRAVNTLDSMVGYKNERFAQFGWASARLDDGCNWLPARLTAWSIWLSSLVIASSRWSVAWKITLRDASKHPSPNSGWSEAMVAALLGVQLGGINFYQGIESKRAMMGERLRVLQATDIHKAVVYMHGGWIVFYLLLVFIVGLYGLVENIFR